MTSVHTCDTTKAPCTLGTSPESAAVRGAQDNLVPGLASGTVTYTCTSMADATLSNVDCESIPGIPLREGDGHGAVQVITPLLSMVAPTSLSSTTHVEIREGAHGHEDRAAA